MDYEKVYYSIIRNAQENIRMKDFEKHHIIPQSLGGSNHQNNIVKLSYREHFICHILLYKMQTEKRPRFQMLTAVQIMSGKGIYKARQYKQMREEYIKTKKEFYVKEKHGMYGTSRSGADNPFYGQKHTEDTRKLLSDAAKDKVQAKHKITGEHLKVTKEEFDSNPLLVGITAGNTVSDEVKERISKSMSIIRLAKTPCIYCGFECNSGNMKQHHGDNCKHKPSDITLEKFFE